MIQYLRRVSLALLPMVAAMVLAYRCPFLLSKHKTMWLSER
ncbi:hypothetical protein JCM19233_6589 [Vibrio astriarenae]|nr:hypothetical protein JCM19233_6589 [Vibrio sp. C7]